MFKNTATYGLLVASALTLSACNTQERTEELVQARLDAEKVKDLTEESVELKKTIDELKAENKELTTEILALKAKSTASVAQAKTLAKKPGTSMSADKPAPSEVQQAKEDLTGGGSFK
jgi:peptidoglycan hydrolase CwlO-like protein